MLVLGGLIYEIAGEAENSREFVPALRIEICVAASDIDRAAPMPIFDNRMESYAPTGTSPVT